MHPSMSWTVYLITIIFQYFRPMGNISNNNKMLEAVLLNKELMKLGQYNLAYIPSIEARGVKSPKLNIRREELSEEDNSFWILRGKVK